MEFLLKCGFLCSVCDDISPQGRSICKDTKKAAESYFKFS